MNKYMHSALCKKKKEYFDSLCHNLSLVLESFKIKINYTLHSL